MSNSESEASTSQQAIKRSLLEVNEADKYKSFMLKQLETKKFKPSDALDRVKQFLPDFKAANEKLLAEAKENPSQVDIENCENDDKVIEMSLAFVPEGDSDSDEEDDAEQEVDGDEGENDDEQAKDSIQKYLKMSEKLLSKNSKKPMIKVIEGDDEQDSDEDDDDEEDYEEDEIDEDEDFDDEDDDDSDNEEENDEQDEDGEENNQNDDEKN